MRLNLRRIEKAWDDLWNVCTNFMNYKRKKHEIKFVFIGGKWFMNFSEILLKKISNKLVVSKSVNKRQKL